MILYLSIVHSFFIAKQYSIARIHHNLCISLLSDGYLNCFQFLTIMNKVDKFLCRCVLLLQLGKHQRMRWPSLLVSAYLNF